MNFPVNEAKEGKRGWKDCSILRELRLAVPSILG